MHEQDFAQLHPHCAASGFSSPATFKCSSNRCVCAAQRLVSRDADARGPSFRERNRPREPHGDLDTVGGSQKPESTSPRREIRAILRRLYYQISVVGGQRRG